MTATSTDAPATCAGCGATKKNAFGLKIHQTAPNAKPECRLAADPSKVAATSAVVCEGLNDLPEGTLTGTLISEFNPQDFREVGKVAEFDPSYVTGQFKAMIGKPVRVCKVNPSRIKVETEDGQVITTDPFMLIPTDKPFNKVVSVPVREMDLVRLDPKVRLKGETTEGVWIVKKRPDLAGKAQVARIGGGGRYYTLPTSTMTVVPASEVLK